MLTRVGEIEIWRLMDWHGLFLTPAELFPNAPGDVAQIIEGLAPGSVDAQTGRLILPVQAYLLKTSDHVVLIDTGLGNGKTSNFLPFWHQLTDTQLPMELAAAGVAPEEVDYVLTTHLHSDHTGWNTRRVDGAWVPTFPNARYLMPAKDEAAMRGRGIASYDENIAPVIEAGQAEMIDASYRLGHEISLMETPGHTPGHVSVMLSSGDHEALITGDAMHSTAQCQNPGWHFKFDWDGEMAEMSRRTLLEACVARKLTVIGFHFVLPALGRVEADGDVFRWVGGTT
ncbi:MAG: MBL fold metallo-hydrolase [Pseudomonadota bacterium]